MVKVPMAKAATWGAMLISCLATPGCNSDSGSSESGVFRSVPNEESGLSFRNDLRANPVQNIFNYMYFYNGGGVGVGDFDGDGLQDVFFGSNQSYSQVYRNLGKLKFVDQTESAGLLRDSVWTTGISVVDVNADGKPDVYESIVSPVSPGQVPSRLYINVSVPGEIRFEERAAEYQLDLRGYGTQAAWLDYDRDGDLDVYLLRHSVHQKGTFGDRGRNLGRDAEAGDLLMRNDGGRFVDATDSAHIQSSALGYGLGVTTADFNQDGWEDIYVANDFHEDDYLYLNDQRGGFREVARQALRHTSRFSMGVDAGDLNLDGLPDIMVLDMLPDDPRILRASAAEDPYNVREMKLQSGYGAQLSRNTLQLSAGLNPDDPATPLYSETALLAGVHASDWSWSVLMQDFDLDGELDLFITNGILGRSNDLDYINFVTTDANQRRLKDRFISEEDLALADQMPVIRLRNRFYRGAGGGSFRQNDVAVGPESFSHGAAYVDFDNDGDLDVVTSDVDGYAQLLENRTDPSPSRWIGVDLTQRPHSATAPGSNLAQIGAVVQLFTGAKLLSSQRVQPTRGFQSTADHRLTFAVPDSTPDLHLVVHWPDGRLSDFRNAATGRYSSLSASDAVLLDSGSVSLVGVRSADSLTFKSFDATALGIDFVHRENTYFEFDAQALLPELTTEEGPALVVADFSGDGRDDVFLGGAKGQASALYTQTAGGAFVKGAFATDPDEEASEAVAAVAFDIDSDGDLDLVVGYGSAEYAAGDAHYAPRVFVNERGNLRYDAARFGPEVRIVTSAMVVSDLDCDGSPELMLFPRTAPGNYGRQDYRGYLLSAVDGKLVDVTARRAPFMLKLGMVTDAVALPRTADACARIAVAYEWGPVMIYESKSGQQLVEHQVAPPGFWSSITVVPGGLSATTNLVLGSLGYNSKLAARGDSTTCMYVVDVDDNGSAEQLITVNYDGTERLFATRDELSKQLVFLRKKFPNYRSFSTATLSEIIPAAKLISAQRTCIRSTASVLARGKANGSYDLEPLPLRLQTSTIRTGASLGGEILLFGNTLGVNAQRGAYDASYGYLLKNGFASASPAQTGLYVPGQSRAARHIRIAGREAVIVARNDDRPVVIWANGTDGLPL